MTNKEAIEILSLFRDKYAAENGLNTEFAATAKSLEAIADFSGKWRDLPPSVVVFAIDTVLSVNVPSWDYAPPWANFRAVNYSGIANWFERRPVPWKAYGSKYWFADGKMEGTHCDNWEETLQERPQRPEKQDQ